MCSEDWNPNEGAQMEELYDEKRLVINETIGRIGVP